MPRRSLRTAVSFIETDKASKKSPLRLKVREIRCEKYGTGGKRVKRDSPTGEYWFDVARAVPNGHVGPPFCEYYSLDNCKGSQGVGIPKSAELLGQRCENADRTAITQQDRQSR